MHPWAVEEVFLRPAATVAVSALVPLGTARLLRAMLRGPALATGGVVVRASEVAVAALAGATALGPALIAQRHAWPSVAFGAACALVALASGTLARRRPSARREAAHGAAEQHARGLGAFVGAVIAIMLAASALAPYTATAIDPADAPSASASSARWRLRIDPWDSAAMLASGWAARRSGAYARALAWAREARAHGASAADVLELEAEVHAARGDCDRARTLFDQALAARAAAAFELPLVRPLELGGYHLPPTLVTGCGAESESEDGPERARH